MADGWRWQKDGGGSRMDVAEGWTGQNRRRMDVWQAGRRVGVVVGWRWQQGKGGSTMGLLQGGKMMEVAEGWRW